MRLRFAGWLAYPAAALAVAASLIPASAAMAAPAKAPAPFSYSSPDTGYTVTLVARQCSRYSDIMANRSRDNSMESLQDLGKNSVYKSWQQVNPATEQNNDPRCAPLNGWQFELGSGYTKPGQLSVVTGKPLVTSGNTRTVPLLGADGSPTHKLIRGATIVKLTSQQYQLAQQSGLWIQGGTVRYPQLENRYGGKYGFGVLRCAVDNRSGANVESVTYPKGTKNAFCYAYYVNPAPAAGTVTIRKVVAGRGISQGFTFGSNLSYNPGHTFALQVSNGRPAAQDFIRAESRSFRGPYVVRELVPNGWRLTGLNCSDTNRKSRWTISSRTASAAITLAARDHVTCTYTDSPPKSPTLTVWKVTAGGAGGPFKFGVTGPVKHQLTAFTKAPEWPAVATDRGTSPTDYKPGNYTITEWAPPPGSSGYWQFVQAYCNGYPVHGQVRHGVTSIQVKLVRGVGQACVFRNAWVPTGRIVLSLRTIGGTAHGSFVVLGPGRPTTIARGRTMHPSVPVTLFDRSHLPFGSWLAYSVTPASSPSHGTWVFDSFTCSKGSTSEPAPQLRVIKLSARAPVAKCLATYGFRPVTQVDLVKTASGAAAVRTGPAVVQVQCRSTADGELLAKGQVVLARKAWRAALPRPLILTEPASCTVRETAIGTVSAKNWTGSATLDGKRLPLPGTFTARVPARGPYLVVVHNTYHAATTPCGTLPLGQRGPDC
jgi:hypothetical protein